MNLTQLNVLKYRYNKTTSFQRIEIEFEYSVI